MTKKIQTMETLEYLDLAEIRCGACHHYFKIALGLASAILCPRCKREIVLGEREIVASGSSQGK